MSKEHVETMVERHWREDEENGGWIDMFATDANAIVTGHVPLNVVKSENTPEKWEEFLAYFRKYESHKKYKGTVQMAKEYGWTITPVADILKSNGIPL